MFDSVDKYKVRNDFIASLKQCLTISGFGSPEYEAFKFVKDHRIAELRLTSKSVKFLDKLVINIRSEVIEESPTEAYLLVFISAIMHVSFSTSIKNTILIVCLPENTNGFIRMSNNNTSRYWKHPLSENVGKLAVKITNSLTIALEKCLEAIILGKPGESSFCNSCSLQLFCLSTDQFKD
jgi:hypothetical protein